MKKIIILLAAVLLASGLTGCGSGKQELHVFNWTYYIPEDILKDFEKEFSVKVVYDVFTSNEEMYAKLKAGGDGYDVVFPSGDYVSIMIKEKMAAQLDRKKLPNLANIDPAFLQRINFDKGNRYSVPFVLGASLVAVNVKQVKNYTESWNIFARKDLIQRMTMLDDMREVLGAALKTHGFSINTTNLAELKKAKETVSVWRDNILKFDAETFAKSFASGALYAVHCYPENVIQEYNEKKLAAGVKFFIPKEGGPMYVDNMLVLESSANKDLAHIFINYLMRPDIYARIIDRLHLPSINVPARKLAKNPPLYKIEGLDKSEFIEDIGDAIDIYNRIWQELRISS